MKSIVLFCTFIILINNIKGQTNEPTVFIPPPPSPTMSSLGIYANIPVDNFTGVPSIQVPLYTLKVKDMEVPISISYHASGIRVEQESSKVGLGWALNAGGIITRQIRDKDDFASCSYTCIFSEYNLNNKENLTFYDQHDNYRIVSPMYYDSNNNNALTRNEDWHQFLFHMRDEWGGTDGEPDIFYVNFPEGVFKFIIDQPENSIEKYKIRILGNNNYTVTLTKNELTNEQNFIITSQNGTEYYFSQVEHQTTKDGFSLDGKTNEIWEVVFSDRTRISGWYLTEIRDKADNYVKFEYTKDGDYKMQPTREQSMRNEMPLTWPYETDIYHLWKRTKITIDNINLKKITSSANNAEIDFQYNADNYRLDKITVNNKVDNRHIDFSFLTSYFGIANDRLKLEKVTKTSGNLSEDYKFFYYGDSGDPEEYILPKMDSYGQDYWGYYNGAVDNDDLIPDNILPEWANTLFQPVMKFNADRNPNSECVKAGSLKKIEYPLGYTVSFEYELHQFSHPIRGEDNMFFPPTSCPDGLFYGGGLRVKKITYDDNGKKLYKEYDYTDGAPSPYTSGQLLRGGRMYFIHFIETLPGHIGFMDTPYAYRTSGNLYASGFSAGGAHVGYSRVVVTEGDNTNKIKKVYNYSAESEESFGTFSFSFVRHNEPEPEPLEARITRLYLVPNLLPMTKPRNGQLISEEWYKEGSNTPIKTINYSYLDKSRTITCYAILSESQHEYPLGLEYECILPNFVLQKKTVTGTDVLNTEETYTYNDYDLVTSVETTESNGSKKKKEIIYNSDFTQNYNQSYSDDLSFLKLKESNIINSVIEQRELVEKNGTTIISGASYLKYKNFSDKILPAEQYLLTNTTPTNSERVSISTTNVFSKNPAYKLQYVFDAFDSYSKLLQMHKDKGNSTSYIWGYNGEYTIATVNNARYDEIYHTSFETEAEQWWTPENMKLSVSRSQDVFHSGKYSLKFARNNDSWSCTVLNSPGVSSSKKYILSGWVKINGTTTSVTISPKVEIYHNSTSNIDYCTKQINNSTSNWQYFEIPVTTPSDCKKIVFYVGNNGWIYDVYFDDLRFCPEDAQMTTYTYDALYGSVTSVTDANNKVTTYEYDDFGKLLRVRDFKGKLIKENLYNYKKYPITQ